MKHSTMRFNHIQEYDGSAARKLLAVDAQNRNDSEYNDDNDESAQICMHYHNVFQMR